MSGYNKQLKIILDSNVIINAKEGNRLDDILYLNHEFFLAESTLEDELSRHAETIKKKILEKSLILVEETDEIREKYYYLSQKYGSGPSRCDRMALATAIINKFGHIATADAQLRRASLEEGVIPLWILDLIGFLLEEGKMTKAEAQKFYDGVFPSRKKSFEKMIRQQLDVCA